MSKETGGPAFPGNKKVDFGDGHAEIQHTPGMTLRDYFAAKAMDALIVGYANHTTYKIADIVFDAYKFADAMLKERDK